MKIALFLEEAGLGYEVVPVDIRKGEQHSPAFRAINPNGKTPALTDGEVIIFDSNAILLYLADKTGLFLPPPGDAARGRLLSWLMFFGNGVAPFSGQAVHFKHFAPAPKDYAVNRYSFEAERHWRLVDAELAKGRYMLGDIYTIVDISVWAWARAIPFILGADAWSSLPNVKRLFDEIGAHPAAKRAEAVAKRFTFKEEMDEEALGHMFPQNKRLATA
jgi:GST-like protein